MSTAPSPSRGPATGTTLPRGEIRSLTGLRAIAATWVVVYHFHYTPGLGFDGFWEPLRPLIRAGATGVDLFYVLSGFVITLTYLDKMGRKPSFRGTLDFLWARVCRIWPVYALVVTLYGGWLIYKAARVTDGNIAYQTVQPIVDLPHYLLQLSMVQLWSHPESGGSSWMGSAWSISAEWLAYCAFPLVVLLLFRLRNAPVVVLAALAVLALVPEAYTTFSTGGPTNEWSWLWRIAGGFLAGSFTCMAVRRIQITDRVRRISGWVSAAALAEILIGLWWGDWRGGDNVEAAFGGVVMLVFPVLVGALALSTTGISKFLARPSLVHGGRISFSLYLVHIPVFEFFWTEMGWHPRIDQHTGLWAILLPHVLLVPFVLAHLLYRYVEEPARGWLRKLLPPRRPQLATVKEAAHTGKHGQPLAAEVPAAPVPVVEVRAPEPVAPAFPTAAPLVTAELELGETSANRSNYPPSLGSRPRMSAGA